MARQKKTIITGVSREQMEEAFGQYATADAEVQHINAEMDRQFVAIREQHADRLAELEQVKADSFEVMQVFATENPRGTVHEAAEHRNHARHDRLPYRYAETQTEKDLYVGGGS